MSHTQTAAALDRNGSGEGREALLRAVATWLAKHRELQWTRDPYGSGPPRVEASAIQPHNGTNLGKAYSCLPFPAIQQQGLPPAAQLDRLTARKTLAAESLLLHLLLSHHLLTPGLGTGCHFLSLAPLAAFILPNTKSCQPRPYLSHPSTAPTLKPLRSHYGGLQILPLLSCITIHSDDALSHGEKHYPQIAQIVSSASSSHPDFSAFPQGSALPSAGDLSEQQCSEFNASPDSKRPAL